MWQTKYASAVPKNLGVGVNFWPCSEGYFLSGRPYSVAAYDSAEIQQLEKIALGPNLVFLLRYIIMMSLVKRGCEI